MKSIPTLCALFIGGFLLVLAGTIVLGYLKGQELYDTAYTFCAFFWWALITVCALCSFITFAVFTIVGLYKHAPRAVIGWHVFCLILALLLPMCVLKTSIWTARISRLALFKNVGIEAIRRDATFLTKNYIPRANSHDRMGSSQRINRDRLPDSFRKLGFGEVYVTKTSVVEMVGGFGGVKSGYTFFPAESNESMPNAEKIADGIYYWVTQD